MFKFINRMLIILALCVLVNPMFEQEYFPINVKSAPVIVLNVPKEFEFNNVKQWRSIEYFIQTSHYSTYVLNWQGYGGYVDIGKEFINKLLMAESQGKTVILNLTGASYSEHANIVCYFQFRNSNQLLMFHADGYSSNGREYRMHKNQSDIMPALTMCVKRGILTQRDLDILWNGNEVYVRNGQKSYEKDDRTLD